MKYCFDIDGTICNNTYGKYNEAKPFPDVIKKVNTLYDAGNKIIFFTIHLIQFDMCRFIFDNY